MHPFEYITMIAAQRQAELIREAEQHRLVYEAFKSETPKNNRFAKMLAYIGKQLMSVGHSMELRFNSPSGSRTALNPQTNPGGCT